METGNKNAEINFTAEIEKFYTEFPEHRGVVFIVNPDKDDSVYDFLDKNPKFVEKQQEYQDVSCLYKNGADLKEFSQFRWSVFNQDHAEKNYQMGGCYYCVIDIKPLIDNKKGLDCNPEFMGFIIPRKNIESSDKYDVKILQQYVLYHEIGHALYEQKNKKDVLSFFANKCNPSNKFRYKTEAAAECYSIIRLAQEHGIDNPTINFIYTKRTIERLKDIESPYNFLPAMHEVARLAKLGGLDNLTPQQSAKLADKITKTKVVSVEDSKEIDRCFWNTYSSLNSGKPILDFARNNIVEAKNQVVLNDIQYILQCLEDTTANNPKIQAVVKTAWKALKENKLVKQQGLLQQHWRVKALKTSKEPKLQRCLDRFKKFKL